MVTQEISVSSARHGGAREGAGRPRRRTLVTSVPALRVPDLTRGGALYPGIPSVHVALGNDTLNVQIAWAVCRFGGWRAFLRCPDCARSTRTLYQANPDVLEVKIKGSAPIAIECTKQLACRQCLGLQYPSQAEGQLARSVRRSSTLLAKLAAGKRKPKWMRLRSYDDIRDLMDAEFDLRVEMRARMKSYGSGGATAMRHKVMAVSELSDAQLRRAIISLAATRRANLSQRHRS